MLFRAGVGVVANKLCGRCQQVKPVEAFSKNRNRPDGLQSYCKECNRDYKQAATRRPDRGPNHGGRSSALYSVWRGMRNRCHDPKAQNYRFYGARGITVCDEWRNSFPTFREWALANGFEPGLQLDRRDNEEGYSPDNCKWTIRLHNLRNRRPYLPVELEAQLQAEAAKRGMPVYALIREAIEQHLLDLTDEGR